MGLCEHRGDGDPAHPWHGEEDLDVAMLARFGGWCITAWLDRLGQSVQQGVDALVDQSQLAMQQLHLRDHHADVLTGSLLLNSCVAHLQDLTLALLILSLHHVSEAQWRKRERSWTVVSFSCRVLSLRPDF